MEAANQNHERTVTVRLLGDVVDDGRVEVALVPQIVAVPERVLEAGLVKGLGEG